jgi:hypothetical protein
MEPLPSLSITFRMYSWSKWGGGTSGLVKEELDEWYCQSCGEKQVRTLPSYMIPMDETQRDYVRVCSDCKAKAHAKKITFCWDLLRIIKHI